MTSTERSRLFRERNPTYHRDRKRRERAAIDARFAMAQTAMLTAVPVKVPLALPAPVESIIPDVLEQLHAAIAKRERAELLPVSSQCADDRPAELVSDATQWPGDGIANEPRLR